MALTTERAWAAYYRNNEALSLAFDALQVPGDPDYFTTVEFELDTHAALNWYLSQDEAGSIVRNFWQDVSRTKPKFWVDKRLESPKTWYGTGGRPYTPPKAN